MSQNDAKILDCWVAPQEAGAPIGVISTTFTFSSEFFEEECLSRFLKLESDVHEEGAIYLIEQEEKLASLVCATVLIDQCHAKVRRNLRWDLIPIRLSQGIMHAKISVLFWANYLRIVIGSANLTTDGYRRNQEIFTLLDLYPDGECPIMAIKEILNYLQFIISKDPFINSSIKDRPLQLINQIKEDIRSWRAIEHNNAQSYAHIYPLLIRPGGKGLLQQMKDLWSKYSNRPPKYLDVCSPFYDHPKSDNKPAKNVWEILNTRNACVNYYCTGEPLEGSSKVLLHAPESLLQNSSFHLSPEINFYRLPEKKDLKSEYRPVHLKSYWMEADNGWVIFIIGSSNFTTNGLGLHKKGNYEANIAFVYNKKNKKINHTIQKARLKGEHVKMECIHWKPIASEEESITSVSILPLFFKAADIIIESEAFFIRFYFDLSKALHSFSLRSESGIEIYNSERWLQEGKPEEVALSWEEPNLPFGFNVYLNDCLIPAWLPVNVHNQHALPPPEDLSDLSLDTLALILTSSRPWYKVLGQLKNQKGSDKSKNKRKNKSDTDIDPHKRVDTSMFLLQRTRKYSLAINSIRKKLEAPMFTQENLYWRIYGPVGVDALVKGLIRESQSLEETVFFISEVILELGKVKPIEMKGCIDAAIVKGALLNYLNDLQSKMDQEVGQNIAASIKGYANKSIKRTKKLLSVV